MTLTVDQPHSHVIWRVGYLPSPWDWAEWRWATDGHHFEGRWDSAEGVFRVLYAGDSLYSCLIECLVQFRRDDQTADAISQIEVDPEDAERYPTVEAGTVPHDWLYGRVAGVAELTGEFGDVTTSASIAHLHPESIGLAKELGFSDFDAAAINDSRSRPLTQAIAGRLHRNTELDGVKYRSRHGSDLTLSAIFEREVDRPARCLASARPFELLPFDPALAAAFDTLGLRWSYQDDDLPPPLVEADPDELMKELFANGDPGPANPYRAVMMWLNCLDDPEYYQTALGVLTANPDQWDFADVGTQLSNLSLARRVRRLT